MSESIAFTEAWSAALDPGDYQLVVSQTVLSEGTTLGSYAATATVSVLGPRFSLLPADLVGLHPPAGSAGEFANVLPHAVLSRRTLPWERKVGTGTDADSVPWLALLVSSAGDSAPAPSVVTRTVADLQTETAPPGTPGLLADGSGILVPNPALETGQATSDVVTCIDLPTAVFASLAPTLADLQWLAHGRIVAQAPDPADPAERSVVVANRVAPAGAPATVFLVSLESLGSVLPSAAGGTTPAGTVAVRLVCLASWTYTPTSGSGDFTTLVSTLSSTPPTLQRPVPASVSDPTVLALLAQGYTAMNHTTRTGDRTVSWYRGPLGVATGPAPLAASSSCADALTRYDPVLGMFDVSFSAAWTLGRLLALQHKPHSSALVTWRAKNQQAAVATRREGARERIGQGLALAAHAFAGVPLEDPPAVARRPSKLARQREARRRLADPAVFAATAGATPPVMRGWLAGLVRLEPVPTSWLVPDVAMMPPESIRAFVVDPAWIAALVDGAVAVGRVSSADIAHDRALLPRLLTEARSATRAGEVAGDAVWSGFLLRSAVVGGWPGMRVAAWDTGQAALQLVRRETLAPGLMLCLFAGAAPLGAIELREPTETLHFGLDTLDPPGKTSLRSLADGSGQSATVTFAWRDPTLQTLDVDGAARQIATTLGSPPFTAAELALEMVQDAASVAFGAVPTPAKIRSPR